MLEPLLHLLLLFQQVAIPHSQLYIQLPANPASKANHVLKELKKQPYLRQ